MKEIQIFVPELPESINQATVIKWHKNIGDTVEQDQILVDIETEKVVLEVSANANGILKQILQPTGQIVTSKQILGCIQETNNTKHIHTNNIIKKHTTKNTNNTPSVKHTTIQFSPSIRRNLSKNNNKHTTELNILLDTVKKDNHLKHQVQSIREKRIPIGVMRKRISERLLRTMHNTAMLTTFNEVNMHKIIEIRSKYRDIFQKKHDVRLGFMPFFIKSSIEALKSFPMINAKVDNDDIIYYKYFDINIAISTTKGLVTPVLKDVNYMSIPEIEKKIKYFISRGNEGKLELSDLLGGNFTITNGGIFGSLLSTPIINPPQIAILGVHTIQERVIVVNNKIKIAPMMYIALSYDHCVIDGKEAVNFLNVIKHTLEDPSRILLNL